MLTIVNYLNLHNPGLTNDLTVQIRYLQNQSRRLSPNTASLKAAKGGNFKSNSVNFSSSLAKVSVQWWAWALAPASSSRAGCNWDWPGRASEDRDPETNCFGRLRQPA